MMCPQAGYFYFPLLACQLQLAFVFCSTLCFTKLPVLQAKSNVVKSTKQDSFWHFYWSGYKAKIIFLNFSSTTAVARCTKAIYDWNMNRNRAIKTRLERQPVAWGTCVTLFCLSFKSFIEALTSVLHAIYPLLCTLTFGNGVFVCLVRKCSKIEGCQARVTRKEAG